MITSCVYAIVSPSNKAYIGSSKDKDKRFRDHVKMMKAGNHHCDGMKRASAKYGCDAFTFEILEQCYRHNLIDREQWWIDNHKLRFAGIYNASMIAGRPEHNEAVRAKIGAKSKGRRPSAQTKQKLSQAMTGRKATAEARENMRKAQAGRKNTEEAKDKMSAAKKGKPRGPMSQETKDRIRAAKLGKKVSAEGRANISRAQLARYERDGSTPKSAETKTRMSEAAFAREARKRAALTPSV